MAALHFFASRFTQALMAISAQEGVSTLSVAQLLDLHLRIPAYQRPYRWEPATALQLLDDITHALHDTQRPDVPYVLGAVILHREDPQPQRPLNVVDGQQRLLTLRMLLAQLDPQRHALHLPEPPARTETPDLPPVLQVWRALRQRCQPLTEAVRLRLAEYIRTRCQLICVTTDDLDEAFRIFDSQNYRGKTLAPHDLLKAYHLREMQHESHAMQAAVVQRWESVPDSDLSRLFGTYLYRIVQWSRQRKAPQFTLHDIGLFKGISAADLHSPVARYHASAQAMLPALEHVAPTAVPPSGAPDLAQRVAAHSRFQLDMPLRAGRLFFEMVDFMLPELERIVHSGFDDTQRPFCYYQTKPNPDDPTHTTLAPGDPRLRYVTELYVAALLLYVNKFGPQHLEEARHTLFRWAYALRINYQRLQYASVDNLACGHGTQSPALFVLLRNALSPQDIYHVQPATPQPPKSSNAQVQQLFALLTPTAPHP